MPKPPEIHAHKLVAEVAVAAAHEKYDQLMFDDMLWAEWKRRHPGMSSKALEAKFVREWAPKCVEIARATLTMLLTQPIDEGLKEQIHEALILDNTLARGRQTAQARN